MANGPNVELDALRGGSSSTTRDAEGQPTAAQTRARAQAEAEAALDVRVARRLFWWGFALLPGLWLMVWLHYRSVAKLPLSDPRLQTYVQRSFWAAACSGALLACWVVTVQATWREWSPEWQRLLMTVAPPIEHDF